MRAASLLAACCAVSVFVVLLMIPAGGSTHGTTRRLAPPVPGGIPFGQPTPARAGQPFPGVAAVGALFTQTGGKLGTHFCTASVVHSPAGDLAVTAAHCVSSRQGTTVFVPGYADGQAPLGIWPVTRVYADSAWRSDQNPDHDVAFIRLADAHGVPIEDVTGAERFAVGAPSGQPVQVIGYPDGRGEPVWCAGLAKRFSPTQLEFDCGGYTAGTSGGPFLTNVNATTGQGAVIGVIGGYEQGGDVPSVSYAAVFGAAAAALYHAAESGG